MPTVDYRRPETLILKGRVAVFHQTRTLRPSAVWLLLALLLILVTSPDARAQSPNSPSVEAQVKKYVNELQTSKNEDVRMVCANILAQIGPPAVPALTALLKPYQDPGVLSAASYALGQIGTPAVPALTALLQNSKDSETLHAATDALGQIRAPTTRAIPALTALIQTSKHSEALSVPEAAEAGYVPGSAAEALGKISVHLQENASNLNTSLETLDLLHKPAQGGKTPA